VTQMLKCMSATAFAAALSVPSVLAADLPKEGNYDFMSCYTGVSNAIAFSKAHGATTSELTGTIQSSPPGGMFDKVAFRCLSFDTTLDNKTTSTTMCEGVDKDGDRYLNHIVNDGQASTRRVVAGTGKYEGMTASGTVMGMGPYAVVKPGTFQNCSHQVGTYKMR
jgi:hypothetical protein